MTDAQLNAQREGADTFYKQHSTEIEHCMEILDHPINLGNVTGHPLVVKAHDFIDTLQQKHKFNDHLQCGKQECSFCCHSEIFIGKTEAAYIKKYAKYEIDADRLAKQRATNDYTTLSFKDKACIMLKDGKCQVYAHRPSLCRNHGAAVGTDPEECHQQNLNQLVPGKQHAVSQPRSAVLEAVTMYVTMKEADSIDDIKNIAKWDW